MQYAALNRKLLAAAVAVTLGLAIAIEARSDGQSNTDPKVYGKTYGEWSAEWWKWAFAGPFGQNAVLDDSGAFCGRNQPRGKVWFLAGTFGGPVERSCTIPANKALFFPLITSPWIDCPGEEDIPDDEIRALLAQFTGGGNLACQLTSEVDGSSTSSLQILSARAQSPKFTMDLPEGHILIGACGGNYLPKGGTTGRAISEGHWVMVPPLSPGKHEIKFHGAECHPETGAVTFETEATYDLNIVRGNRK